MMLPQFGFIVAQAGADSHTLPVTAPPPPAVPSASASSLAPLLHSKPFHFGHSNSSVGNSNSSNMSTSNVGYYHNKYTTSPYYSRRTTPPPSQHAILPNSTPPTSTITTTSTTRLPPPPPLNVHGVTPPPPSQTSYLYSNSTPPKDNMPKGFTSVLDTKKKKELSSPWYRHQPSPAPAAAAPAANTNTTNNTTLNTPYYPRHSSMIEVESSEDHITTTKWHEPKITNTSRQEVKEFNDLMTWMDNEFWEQADEIYQEKLSNLQNELVLLQKGTHSAFREMIADYEFKREKTIKDAECFMKYEISFIEQCFDQDMNALQDEYETERKQLQDTLITSIEDKRRQIKDDTEDNNDTEDAGTQSSNSNNNARSKRNLRKRNADTTTLKTEPLSKRRAVRPSTLHNIHTISPIEDEELEAEYLTMKASASVK